LVACTTCTHFLASQPAAVQERKPTHLLDLLTSGRFLCKCIAALAVLAALNNPSTLQQDHRIQPRTFCTLFAYRAPRCDRATVRQSVLPVYAIEPSLGAVAAVSARGLVVQTGDKTSAVGLVEVTASPFTIPARIVFAVYADEFRALGVVITRVEGFSFHRCRCCCHGSTIPDRSGIAREIEKYFHPGFLAAFACSCVSFHF
jgi:hypothetical protein